MANKYFQFKEFRIEQDRCGMKVCTDSCIQGAYTSKPNAQKILDIGTGTALLSLMLAQKHPQAWIDAVEIDPQACEQAQMNIINSPWGERIKLHQEAIQTFSPAYLYELIICNPPFYPDHLASNHPQRRQAFHHEKLNFRELADACKRLLAPDGCCSIMLPPRQMLEFSLLAQEKGLYLQKQLFIKPNPQSPPHRTISFYTNIKTASPEIEELIIQTTNGSYTPEFQKLLKPYYLIF